MDYTDINARTIDLWVEQGWEWGRPISHEEYSDALNGKWEQFLTPVKVIPKEWFPDLKGLRVLGLAAGGGQQMPIFAALGADCTVMDYSVRQLESERMVSCREGYSIDIVRGDMTKTFPFEDGSFDLIFHPVSNCYVRDVQHVWNECARVLKSGGLLMAGLDNGMNYIVSEEDPSRITGKLPYDPLSDPDLLKSIDTDADGIQFSHTAEEQIRGQLKAGFELLDIFEDTNGEGFLHEHGIPSFWATLARKK